jgi:hypothetical protein
MKNPPTLSRVLKIVDSMTASQAVENAWRIFSKHKKKYPSHQVRFAHEHMAQKLKALADIKPHAPKEPLARFMEILAEQGRPE